jgi:hypothetical protein
LLLQKLVITFPEKRLDLFILAPFAKLLIESKELNYWPELKAKGKTFFL